MFLLRPVKRAITSNGYLFSGVLLGILGGLIFQEDMLPCGSDDNGVYNDIPASFYRFTETGNTSVENQLGLKQHYKMPQLPPVNTNLSSHPRTSSANSVNNNNNNGPVRPRYYSTELGIREKLFVGVFTSEDRLESHAIHVNATIAHLVDRVKYFLGASQRLRTRYQKYTGLVGFTDSRHRYRPFQVVKYLADNLPNYDYYFLANDFNYIDARRLNQLVNQISVSANVYMGTSVLDASYCDMDAGILISNGVLTLMREHIDWCVMNAVSDFHSENVGRCVFHSTGLECQRNVQNQVLGAFKLKQYNLKSSLDKFQDMLTFNTAVTVYPVLLEQDFYILHTYFSKKKLNDLNNLVSDLTKTIEGKEWPVGRRSGSLPATRHDVPKTLYFNLTHMYFPDDFTSIREHTQADLADIMMVLEAVKAKALHNNEGNLQFRRLINGYRTFQLSRGLDYKLDLGFRDLHTGKEVIKRFEVCKPLGNVELISVPYVTENNRVVVLVPIEEHQTDESRRFILSYVKTIMEHREKSFLMLVFLYQANSSSKGESDPFNEIKSTATKLTARMNSEDTKIGWVSIRLPPAESSITLQDYPTLNFAVIDLALKKIGLESLIIVVDVYSNFTVDFLNRVRMNTILNFQVFSVIPFRQYNPTISHYDTLEVNKNTGQFDNEEYRFLSFYARDYVYSRKLYRTVVPLVRIDTDVTALLHESVGLQQDAGNVFAMFVRYPGAVHCFRAPDMSLRMRYSEPSECLHVEVDMTNGTRGVCTRHNWFLGNKAQLGALVLNHLDQIP